VNNVWRAICPIRQYGEKLVLQCNSYKKGHTHLVWYNTSDPENKKSVELLKSEVTISGLTAGEYAFYTKSDDDSSSVRIYVEMLVETPKDTVKKLYQYIDIVNSYHNDALKLLEECLDSKPSVRPIDALISLYKAAEADNIDKQKAYYELITISQYCENSRSLVMNKDNEAPMHVNNNPIASIEVGPMVTKVVIYKLINGAKMFHSLINIEFVYKHSLKLADNTEYVLEVYADIDIVGIYIHFSGNGLTKKWLWEDKCSTADKLSDIKGQLLDLPAALASFSDEDKQRLSIEREKNPYNELVARPQVIVSNNKVDVIISDPKLLTSLNNFYVVAKEPDQLFVNGFDRIEKITGPTLSFNKAKHLLSDEEDYYFYIQDDSRHLVSNLELVSLAETNYDEYKYNCRQVEFYNYSKRLITLMNYRAPNASEVVKLLIDIANGDPDVNIANIHKYLISHLALNKHLSYFNSAVNAIMEDHISHSLFSQKFFPDGIKHDRVIDKLIFPPKTDAYILQVYKINLNQEEIITEYYESDIGAIEVQTRGADYFIFQAIDKQSYRRSGYVFVNAAKYSSCVTNWNVDIEVI